MEFDQRLLTEVIIFATLMAAIFRKEILPKYFEHRADRREHDQRLETLNQELQLHSLGEAHGAVVELLHTLQSEKAKDDAFIRGIVSIELEKIITILEQLQQTQTDDSHRIGNIEQKSHLFTDYLTLIYRKMTSKE